MHKLKPQHVFIVGAKCLGAYGGYETFVYKLTEYHQDLKDIQYHIACKANGYGCMDESILDGVEVLSDNEFKYHNALCFKIKVPLIGPAQAIYYDVASLNYCLDYIKKNNIEHPIIYILTCRIGLFIKHFYKQIHKLGGVIYLNPDGHEWMRAKWSYLIRKYWKLSERLMVNNCDLLICDSKNIEKYINEEYGKFYTTYIAYGAEVGLSKVEDDEWYRKWNISKNNYYLIVGRFVPENSFEIMIKEFMKSNSNRDLVIITSKNDKYFNELENKLHFSKDSRVKFVGTVYDQELLKNIRENAYAYIHGHTVGGTNPSLIEALGSTKLNLLIDVGFNKEVGEDSALYWNKDDDNLKNLINDVDNMNEKDISELGKKAKDRVLNEYTWDKICKKYEDVFINGINNK